jgi:hypothetical protein
MILGDARKLLRERRRLSLFDMALILDVAPSAVDGMMAVLIQTGQVRELSFGSCGGCKGCGAAPRVFEWADGTTPDTSGETPPACPGPVYNSL